MDAEALKHRHFLIMGGFHLVEPPEGTEFQYPSTPDAERGRATGNKAEVEAGGVTILTLEMLRELVNDPEFRIRIMDGKIGDRSKGELAKVILIMQSLWFICQCIVRWAQGVSLTQLELTTFALASLNGITFMLWWEKPLGVPEVPVRVYMNRKLTKHRLLSSKHIPK